jgi:hypothetical protein
MRLRVQWCSLCCEKILRKKDRFVRAFVIAAPIMLRFTTSVTNRQFRSAQSFVDQLQEPRNSNVLREDGTVVSMT